MLKFPDPADYAHYYARYITPLAETDILPYLERQAETTAQFYLEYGAELGDFRYAPGKWTLNDILGHITDGERIFSFRALHIARGDQTPIPGFDEDNYANASNAGSRSMPELVEDFRIARTATLSLFRGFSDELWGRAGTANNTNVRVRAYPFIIAGHTDHHERIIRERYLPAM